MAGLIDSGNLIPGSAAMSAEFAASIGAVLEHYSLEVCTEAQGGSLEVVGRIPEPSLAVSPNLVIVLTNVVVIQNLSPPLNLSMKFFNECQASLDYSVEKPQIHIKGEQLPIVAKLNIKKMEVQPRD